MNLIDFITLSREVFFYCVEECNNSFRSEEGLSCYHQIIDHHRQTCDLNKIIDQEDFIPLIRRTLIEWNMNQRGAELSSLTEIEKSIFQHRRPLIKLYDYKLHELDEKTANQITTKLEIVFGGLNIMKSKRRIVGVSKALHFLIPDLIMPIDSTYTMPAIYGCNRYSSDREKETKDFIYIFRKTVKIAQRLNLSPSDADGKGWNTSIPKLIDNAIIGHDKLGPGKFEAKLKS